MVTGKFHSSHTNIHNIVECFTGNFKFKQERIVHGLYSRWRAADGEGGSAILAGVRLCAAIRGTTRFGLRAAPSWHWVVIGWRSGGWGRKVLVRRDVTVDILLQNTHSLLVLVLVSARSGDWEAFVSLVGRFLFEWQTHCIYLLLRRFSFITRWLFGRDWGLSRCGMPPWCLSTGCSTHASPWPRRTPGSTDPGRPIDFWVSTGPFHSKVIIPCSRFFGTEYSFDEWHDEARNCYVKTWQFSVSHLCYHRCIPNFWCCNWCCLPLNFPTQHQYSFAMVFPCSWACPRRVFSDSFLASFSLSKSEAQSLTQTWIEHCWITIVSWKSHANVLRFQLLQNVTKNLKYENVSHWQSENLRIRTQT